MNKKKSQKTTIVDAYLLNKILTYSAILASDNFFLEKMADIDRLAKLIRLHINSDFIDKEAKFLTEEKDGITTSYGTIGKKTLIVMFCNIRAAS